MAQQILGGADLLDVAGGGFISRGVETFLDNASSMIRNSLPQAGLDFMNNWRSAYQTLDIDGAMSLMDNLQRKSDTSWDATSIRTMTTLQDTQTAGPVMQRWIMAQEEIRTRFVNQSLAGYDDAYVNYHGDAVGEDHYDWRRVKSGVGHLENDEYVKKRYGDLLYTGDEELRPSQKMSIMTTWDFLSRALDNDEEDPTCPYGTAL